MIRYSTRPDSNSLRKFFSEFLFAIRGNVDVLASRSLEVFKRHAPRRTGRLADSLSVKVTRQGRGFEFEVSSTAKYFGFVVGGTGLYGPFKRKIKPVKAKALRFNIGGKTIFARSVKGQKPNDFVGRAVDEINRTLLPGFLSGLKL